jgi:hypothetical protein
MKAENGTCELHQIVRKIGGLLRFAAAPITRLGYVLIESSGVVGNVRYQPRVLAWSICSERQLSARLGHSKETAKRSLSPP